MPRLTRMGLGLGSGGGVRAWDPNSLYKTNARAVYDPVPANQTRSGAMGAVVASGTSPPTVTLSGTAAATVTGVRIEITTAGTLGVAAFKWSSDNGDNYTTGVLTGASVVLGASGITAAFAAGTYSVTTNTPSYADQYVSYPVISQQADKTPLARHLNTVAGLPQQIPANQDYNDHPAIRFAAAEYMDAASWSSESQPVTIVCVVSRPDLTGGFLFDSASGAHVEFSLSLGTPGVYWWGGSTEVNSTYSGTQVGITGTRLPVTYLSGEVHVLSMEFNGASSTFYVDGVLKATLNAGASAQASFRLGARRLASSHVKMDFLYSFQLNKIRSAGERARDDVALKARFIPGIVVCHGDSLTGGTNGSPLAGGIDANSVDYPTVMRATRVVGRPIRVHNYGVPGKLLSAMVTDAATTLDPLYSTARPFNVVVLWGGVNDWAGGGRTGAQCYADVVTYTAARVAVGWKVVVLTNIAANATGPQETERLDFNARLRANSSGAAYTLADPAGDARFQNINDTTYYAADKVHLTTLGYSIIASTFAGPAVRTANAV